jgi:GNAT superfamily N-acetyltransferase
MRYSTVPLNPSHKKAAFICGKETLDTYIHKQAKQDVKAKVAACFVLADDNHLIKGYYTLSNDSIPRDQLPAPFLQKLPKYKALPVTLLGRLAIDRQFQGQQLGQFLLMDALKRSLDASYTIGAAAVIVDPLDQEAAAFYKKFGFILLPDSGRMFLPMATIEQAFRALQ